MAEDLEDDSRHGLRRAIKLVSKLDGSKNAWPNVFLARRRFNDAPNEHLRDCLIHPSTFMASVYKRDSSGYIEKARVFSLYSYVYIRVVMRNENVDHVMSSILSPSSTCMFDLTNVNRARALRILAAANRCWGVELDSKTGTSMLNSGCKFCSTSKVSLSKVSVQVSANPSIVLPAARIFRVGRLSWTPLRPLDTPLGRKSCLPKRLPTNFKTLSFG